MRNIKNIFVLIVVLGLLYHFRINIISFIDSVLGRDKTTDIEKLENTIKLVKKDIVNAPEPLINKITNKDNAVLTIEGILKITNEEREKEGLGALKLNSNLSAGAEAKALDMFNKGYFAHESPDGRGPSEVAEAAGYEYIVVGENLALGGFKDDKDLVDAWMASPGHRENILRKEYKEIGISVKKGLYEGRMRWMAVQEFGTPASLCKKPNSDLYVSAQASSEKLKSMRKNLEERKVEIDAMDKDSAEYRQAAENYNDSVREYNSLVVNSGAIIDQYNSEVKVYNSCLGSYTN